MIFLCSLFFLVQGASNVSPLQRSPTATIPHCNDPIRFGHFEHLELSRCCIVAGHLLAANSKLVENFEPSSEYSLWCWKQRKIVSEYSQLACEWFLPWQEIRLKVMLLKNEPITRISQRHLPTKTRQMNSKAKHQTTYSIRGWICKSTPGKISFELFRRCRWSHICPKKWLFCTNFSQGLSWKVGFFLIF